MLRAGLPIVSKERSIFSSQRRRVLDKRASVQALAVVLCGASCKVGPGPGQWTSCQMVAIGIGHGPDMRRPGSQHVFTVATSMGVQAQAREPPTGCCSKVLEIVQGEEPGVVADTGGRGVAALDWPGRADKAGGARSVGMKSWPSSTQPHLAPLASLTVGSQGW